MAKKDGPVLVNRAARMKDEPTINVRPLKTCMPVYEPPSRARMAPPMGLAVRPEIEAARNRRPVLYPISRKGDILTTIDAARAM